MASDTRAGALAAEHVANATSAGGGGGGARPDEPPAPSHEPAKEQVREAFYAFLCSFSSASFDSDMDTAGGEPVRDYVEQLASMKTEVRIAIRWGGGLVRFC